MKISVCLSIVAVTGMTSAGCTKDESRNPSGPTSTAGASQIFVMCPEFGESSRCTAFATVGGSNGQDVTGLAQWSTSDPAVASISSTGLVTAQSTGEVSIRASYQAASGFVIRWVIPGQGLYGTSRTLSGQILSTNGALPDVLMQILNGPNAGRGTTTGVNGRFLMEGLQDSLFTIRLSKPGYVTAEYQWSIPGGADRTATLSPSK